VVRLQAAILAIKAAMEISNSPSVSLGVMHKGKVICRESIGLRDVEANLEATSDTPYFMASYSKMFTATALGILVEEEKISWNDPIVTISQTSIQLKTHGSEKTQL
jgi:CubicO group peptidase (beta-lactamase class C family)